MGTEEKTSPFESKAQIEEIDGATYKVLPVDLDSGVPALVRLIKIASPLIGAFTSGDVAKVLETLPIALDEKDVLYFADLFGKSSFYADGDKWIPLIRQPQNFRSLHFAGEYTRFLKWMTFNIKVNFGPFFNGAMGEIASALAKKASALKSTHGNGSQGD